MNNLVTTLWKDEDGFLISAELVIVATILVLGLIVGITNLQTAMNAELIDVGEAVGGLDQSYSYAGFRSSGFGKVKAWKAGSSFSDGYATTQTNFAYDIVPQPIPEECVECVEPEIATPCDTCETENPCPREDNGCYNSNQVHPEPLLVPVQPRAEQPNQTK